MSKASWLLANKTRPVVFLSILWAGLIKLYFFDSNEVSELAPVTSIPEGLSTTKILSSS